VPPGIARDLDGKIERIFLSARTGEGLDLLRSALKEYAEQAHPAELLT
jgi:GTP-binding protein HflX